MAGVTEQVLPEGWIETKLENTISLQNGFAYKSNSYVDQGAFVIRIGNVQDGYISLNNPAYVDFSETIESPFALKAKDILISLTGNVGRVGIIEKTQLPAVLNQRVARVLVSENISRKYVFYILQAKHTVDEMLKYAKGAAQLNISTKDIIQIIMPLPSFSEQKVLAEKLDKLLAQVESTKARLERLPEILKRFRQSVLAAAVSGRLTEEWREGKELSSPLEIISDSAAFITTKKAKELAEKPFLDDELTFLIPESWHWVRLSKITEIVSGVAKGSKNKGDTVLRPYLRVANVQRGFLDLEEIKDIDVPESKAEALELKNGDILFNEGGDLDKLGRGWIWENQIPNCIHQNHVFRARCLSEGLEPKFISYYGNSEGKEYFIRNGTQSVNLASINKTTLSLLPVPLPPAEEQTEIVRRVEELFAYADTIQEQADAALQRVNSLTQSILAKAFRGELTADWRAANPELISGENSAEALLEKIKAERAAQKPKKKTRAKKTA